MKRPCAECPFLVGSSFEQSMSEERAQEIADSLGNGMFTCHKTGKLGDGSNRFCRGALRTMQNEYGDAGYNQMVRICERLGDIDWNEIDTPPDSVYDTMQEWVEAHEPSHLSAETHGRFSEP